MEVVMAKKIIFSLVIIFLFSALWLTAADKLPEGRTVKVYIQDKIFKGELLAVTTELVVIRLSEKDKEKEKEFILGCPLAETELVKVVKNCGPIGNIFTKSRKFTFKNTPDTINANVAELCRYALYGSKLPDHVREQMKLYGQV
jgi:hypothetical protein